MVVVNADISAYKEYGQVSYATYLKYAFFSFEWQDVMIVLKVLMLKVLYLYMQNF